MAWMTVLQKLTQLHLDRPSADAAPDVLAEWYRRKADMLRHVAGDGTPAAERWATDAERHADMLRRNCLIGGVPGQGKSSITHAALGDTVLNASRCPECERNYRKGKR